MDRRAAATVLTVVGVVIGVAAGFGVSVTVGLFVLSGALVYLGLLYGVAP